MIRGALFGLVPFAVFAVFAVFPIVSRDAGSDAGAGDLRVAATCERASGPGRVRCDVEVRGDPTTIVRWADVGIVATPPFLAPLRGRVGPVDAVLHDPSLYRFAIALVARDRGAGDVTFRVRAVSCTADGTCAPTSREIAARVTVGLESP